MCGLHVRQDHLKNSPEMSLARNLLRLSPEYQILGHRQGIIEKLRESSKNPTGERLFSRVPILFKGFCKRVPIFLSRLV